MLWSITNIPETSSLTILLLSLESLIWEDAFADFEMTRHLCEHRSRSPARLPSTTNTEKTEGDTIKIGGFVVDKTVADDGGLDN